MHDISAGHLRQPLIDTETAFSLDANPVTLKIRQFISTVHSNKWKFNECNKCIAKRMNEPRLDAWENSSEKKSSDFPRKTFWQTFIHWMWDMTNSWNFYQLWNHCALSCWTRKRPQTKKFKRYLIDKREKKLILSLTNHKNKNQDWILFINRAQFSRPSTNLEELANSEFDSPIKRSISGKVWGLVKSPVRYTTRYTKSFFSPQC